MLPSFTLSKVCEAVQDHVTNRRCVKTIQHVPFFKPFLVCLTLKTPRKTASENVCLCRLLNILANFSNLFLHTGFRSSLIWVHTVCKNEVLKSQADDKANDNSCDWRFMPMQQMKNWLYFFSLLFSFRKYTLTFHEICLFSRQSA